MSREREDWRVVDLVDFVVRGRVELVGLGGVGL